ncbi:glycerol-3-phosphate dehydrogenase (NAD(P)+) [Deinobacterium chartae]|uniref:Glycerol-3-phosphate dehydrogenase [NAD(P)+] n=1 Tax=Deinobacterium chartae TaxID=521158 RepID=A0A841I0W7_9DEIO|nr:NAD(P)H-dependent glycerol-3-phosphate dehydrogenase [Deinobacterium chartae]MBB6098736.1 glycerol-3-phosphate dehydrogenase (NAD(P)+) [Deinobacterium chartae]
MTRVAVLGAGGWGTALAAMLAAHERPTVLWARRAEFAERLRRERVNADYLPGVDLPASLELASDLNVALEGAALALVVVPSVGVEELLEQLPRELGIVLCAKGLDAHGGQLSRLAHSRGFSRIAVLSGPNHAEEIGRGLPAATVVASHDAEFANTAQRALMTPSFRVYTSDDVVGVELGGVLKNVIALSCGMVDGLGLGDNAKAALITRGLLEMRRYLEAQGAREATVYGLSGLGDLVATCTSRHSRNRAAGERIARGEDIAAGGKVVEGMRSARLLHAWALEHGADLPIVAAVHGVLEGELEPLEAMSNLMERRARPE